MITWSAFLLEIRKSFTFDQVDRRIEGRVGLLHRCGGGVADDHLQTACCCRFRTDRRSMRRLLGCWDVGNNTTDLTGASRFWPQDAEPDGGAGAAEPRHRGRRARHEGRGQRGGGGPGQLTQGPGSLTIMGGYSSKKSLFFLILAITLYFQVLYISSFFLPF